MLNPHEALARYWGFASFRPLQEAIVRNTLEGRDTLALLPTGGGKSLCYQVPAVCSDGLCLVVSPLVALMKDQVRQLLARNIPAAAVYAGMPRRELDRIFENACNGAYKLLYLSPERLQTDLAQARLQRMRVNLLAVDEAHCISQWGYDFRPPYLRIAEVRALLPGVPVLALTATATPDVVLDIQEKLAFRAPNVLQSSFQRSNLSYSVLYEDQKKRKLVDVLAKVPGSGLVYVRSRGETRELAAWLQHNGIKAGHYHAGLSHEERTRLQDDWLENRLRIMVCTNAFGMGIDKPDVRVVVHWSLPDSLEAYFQEAGRAGRDGKKAYAVLLYAPVDADNLRRQLESAYPDAGTVQRVYQALGAYSQLAVGAGAGESIDFDLPLFSQTYGLELPVVHAALRQLEQEGWLALTESGQYLSKLWINVRRDVLYDYQLRNPGADAVSNVLLRLYPGIQYDAVDISEGAVGRLCNLTPDQVEAVLRQGAQENVWEYSPKTTRPQLVFLRERVAAADLELDFTAMRLRRNRAEKRLLAAVQYASQKDCRSRLLLGYFGEHTSEKCGICDVCTGRNRVDEGNAAFEALENKISQLLKREALTPEETLEAFSPRQHETVAHVLQYLLDEGRLTTDDDGKLRYVNPS